MSAELLTAAHLVPIQSPSHVVMVRPHRFSVNPDTAADNAFQRNLTQGGRAAAEQAYRESTQLAEALTREGIGVTLVDDEQGLSPDSVFPNNWFTTHADGRVVLCPMFAPNRRHERRSDVLELLAREFEIREVLDFSAEEDGGEFLEGTGSVVIDHRRGVAFGCRSHRLTPRLFQRYCAELDLEPVLFDAVDSSGTPIYHTNVMMSVATEFAMVGLELIPDRRRRDEIAQRLAETGRTVIALDASQIANFAGNTLELSGKEGRVLALS
ncbi:MAG: amidinotransferase, partial [Acidobacteria bacterium]|nr:amidinotransferase [Acidobacteriota bacterium]